MIKIVFNIKGSEETIQEEEEITPTKTRLLGAIKSRLPGGKKGDSLNESDVNATRVKGKLKKENSVTSETSIPETNPDSIHLQEIKSYERKKRRAAPTRDPTYDNPIYSSPTQRGREDDDDAVSISDATDSDTDQATEA